MGYFTGIDKKMDKNPTKVQLAGGGMEGVFPKIGGGILPPKWMVKIMVPNPMNKWMIWGVFKNPYIIFGNTHHDKPDDSGKKKSGVFS